MTHSLPRNFKEKRCRLCDSTQSLLCSFSLSSLPRSPLLFFIGNGKAPQSTLSRPHQALLFPGTNAPLVFGWGPLGASRSDSRSAVDASTEALCGSPGPRWPPEAHSWGFGNGERWPFIIGERRGTGYFLPLPSSQNGSRWRGGFLRTVTRLTTHVFPAQPAARRRVSQDHFSSLFK